MINTIIMFFIMPIAMVAVLASVAEAVLEHKENGTMPAWILWVWWVLFLAGYCYSIHCYNDVKKLEGVIEERQNQSQKDQCATDPAAEFGLDLRRAV